MHHLGMLLPPNALICLKQEPLEWGFERLLAGRALAALPANLYQSRLVVFQDWE